MTLALAVRTAVLVAAAFVEATKAATATSQNVSLPPTNNLAEEGRWIQTLSTCRNSR